MIPHLAITHVPSARLPDAQRTFVLSEPIDGELARQQHASYCQTLRDLSVEVLRLDMNRALPDSVFIEDTAVLLDEIAVLAQMGTRARQAEPSGIATTLRTYRETVPLEQGTLEGGDVLRLGRTLLVGRSRRTDIEGIESLAGIVSRYGYQVIDIPIERCLHLKTACTALPDGRLLINPAWISSDRLAEQRLHCVNAPDPFGANILPIGETVLLPAAHARTAESLEQAGLKVMTTDISEFAKAEGALLVELVGARSGLALASLPVDELNDLGNNLQRSPYSRPDCHATVCIMPLPTSPAESQAKAGVNLYVAIKVVTWLAVPCALAALAAWMYFGT